MDSAKLESACRAFVDTGIRGILAVMLKDRSPDGKPLAVSEDESWIDRVRQTVKRLSQFGSSVTFMLAPSAPQLCSDRLLISCRNLSEELNMGIHTHLAETKPHAEFGRRLYGESLVKHLEKIGFLGPKLSVAHANWLDENDMDVLRKHDVKVVHNPSANTKLGSGFAKVKKMLRKGLTVALGADSVNAGTVYSIFEQMKLSILIPRVLWESEDWLLPEEAFAMGSIGGAKALLLDQQIGSIEAGKKADLVILNPGTSLTPLNNIINQLVLGENDKAVETVFVDGKAIVLEGQIQTVDEDNILARIGALAPRINTARKQVLATRAQ
jgi:cytosine/adenosine deaminase-related metal-dependent hydrolase